MSTIMTSTVGGVERRCDDTCHQARTARCRCICGGRYHGSGGGAQGKLSEDIHEGLWAGTTDAEGVLQLTDGPIKAAVIAP